MQVPLNESNGWDFSSRDRNSANNNPTISLFLSEKRSERAPEKKIEIGSIDPDSL